MTEQGNCWLVAIRTPPPLEPLRSLRKILKLGRSAKTSVSVMSSVSHVSVSISMLLADDETRLQMCSRLGRKLRIFVKIIEKERAGNLPRGLLRGSLVT